MKTCLIVDDSSTMRKIVSYIVSELGFTCREAENGQKARESCAHSMPDLIMLDWNMPVMTGIDFIQILRHMPDGDHPKVIFCTTESDFAFIERALAAGCNEYIMKPFDKNIVETKLIQLGMLEAPAA